MSKQPIVSSLSMAFKRATQITEDQEQAKKEHRQSLKTLIDQYMEDVQSGKAAGIRNAKDLVEVMKMDLLLMGEATERTENANEFDEIRVHKISQLLDLNSKDLRKTMSEMLMTLNDLNDEADIGTNKKEEVSVGDGSGISIMQDDEALMELANQAMQDYVDNMQSEDSEEKE